MAETAALIGLDWGITRLRAYVIGAGAEVLASAETADGILGLEGGDFEAVFRHQAGAMVEAAAGAPDLPILASGMITSRQGWVETPYVTCPAGAAALAADLVAHGIEGGRRVHFVPGVTLRGADGVPDVMRGEETQIVGQLAAIGGGLMVLPGSHSKWALATAASEAPVEDGAEGVVEDGEITWFATFMTGELYAVLRRHSILGRLMAADPPFDRAAFARGLDYAGIEGSSSGGLLKRLFSARSLGLFDELGAQAIPDYLSGLLIGTEITEALACIEARSQAVTVIGGAALAERYLAALAHFGLTAGRAAPDIAARGLHAIARAAGLVAAP